MGQTLISEYPLGFGGLALPSFTGCKLLEAERVKWPIRTPETVDLWLFSWQPDNLSRNSNSRWMNSITILGNFIPVEMKYNFLRNIPWKSEFQLWHAWLYLTKYTVCTRFYLVHFTAHEQLTKTRENTTTSTWSTPDYFAQMTALPVTDSTWTCVALSCTWAAGSTWHICPHARLCQSAQLSPLGGLYQ